MAICPSGHESASKDFCAVCGLSIGAPPLSSVDAGIAVISPPGGTPGPAAVYPHTAPGATCPRCDMPRTGQFCEACGYNFDEGGAAPAPPPQAAVPAAPPFAAPPAPPLAAVPVPPPVADPPAPPPFAVPPVQAGGPGASPASWSAVVTADRDYFDAVLAASGQEAEGIDFPVYCPERRFHLSGDDVRIGRHSASRGLEPEIDLTGPPSDPGISRLHAVLIVAPDGSWSVLDPGSANGTLVNGAEIPRGEPVPLRDGDRINLGAWTLVTISRD